jgi:hypothetical protein
VASRKTGHRQDEGAQITSDRTAEEHHLADRVGRHQPFRQRRDREQTVAAIMQRCRAE